MLIHNTPAIISIIITLMLKINFSYKTISKCNYDFDIIPKISGMNEINTTKFSK